MGALRPSRGAGRGLMASTRKYALVGALGVLAIAPRG